MACGYSPQRHREHRGAQRKNSKPPCFLRVLCVSVVSLNTPDTQYLSKLTRYLIFITLDRLCSMLYTYVAFYTQPGHVGKEDR